MLGLDRDGEALAAAGDGWPGSVDRVTTGHSRFDRLAEVIDGPRSRRGCPAPCSTSACRRRSSTGPTAASATAARARSTCAWTADGRWTAADVVNGDDERRAGRVIRDYGDERFAGRIARAIVAARPISTTTELAEMVTAAIPAPPAAPAAIPAKRTFQAMRIEVNGELDVLPGASTRPSRRPRPGGRIAVLTYHSGEDRIVKQRFAAADQGDCACPRACRACAAPSRRSAASRRPQAAAEQAERNPRAPSARLRVVEKLGPDAPVPSPRCAASTRRGADRRGRASRGRND